MGNLQLMGSEQEYEDDFRIAIRTLQVSIFFVCISSPELERENTHKPQRAPFNSILSYCYPVVFFIDQS